MLEEVKENPLEGSNLPVKKTRSSCIGTVKKVWKNVTLEPMLFLKMLAEGNIRVVANNLRIDRVCRVNLNFSDEDCLAMDDGNHSVVQSAVQHYQNNFNYYQGLIDVIFPVLMILFAGSLSDRYGRKLPMCSVIIGFIASAGISILTVLNPSWPVEAFYAANLFIGITGTWVVFNMAVYSYMADITAVETRTQRMGWVDAVWCLGGPIGTLLGGWTYRTFGYVTVFAVSGILWIFCLMYVILVVKESVAEATSSASGPVHLLKDLGRAALRSYPFNGRFHLLALMAVKLGVFLTKSHHIFLWARRVIGWDTAQFSIWSGTDEVVHQVGTVVWVGLAAYYHFSDHTVVAVGLISLAAWSVVLGCIVGPGTWWLSIVATLLGSLEGSVEPGLRSLITSIPDKNDIGKILALLGLVESIWLIVHRSTFTAIYNACVETFPQINFVVQGAFAGILVLIVLLLKRDWFRERRSLAIRIPSNIESN